MTEQHSDESSTDQHAYVSGVYGVWRLRLSWEPNPEFGTQGVPASKLWPDGRFSGVVDHFRDTVNLLELELDLDA